ncbi:sigma-54-dependent Fis family transcriptional regulator [Pseudonocardia sp. N23]|uniref:sigma-54-dependent Fis family transcriptional regulator n=1 Tax=Pseudonocardia sp. N23 TaxID=1987376 RepID=UPI000BFCBDC7|nr:helix-turn-helix domain-containing protein [Pseudonocardia sp. N23]GAY07239.1 two component, sigma54 specific, transcriptional regulator, Fis family [Pseudonocardia sp. N23]
MSTTYARQLRSARDEFVVTGQVPERYRAAVRPEIAASWARSRSSGASPEEVHLPALPEIDQQSELAVVAGRVLDRLAAEIDDLGGAVFLANAQAQLVRSWIPDEMVRTSLRRILAEPGASCNEAHVGTNGIGTALADGQTKIIGGPEHWGELHQDMTCVAAPILHPVTRRPAGVLNVTLMDQRIHPALTALVRWGVEEIRQGLLEQTGRAERLLFEQFMARRRSDRPSLLLSPRLCIADPAAAALLPDLDAAELWDRVNRSRQPGGATELELADGVVVPVNVTQVDEGLLIEVRRQGRPPRRRSAVRPSPTAAYAAAEEAGADAIAGGLPLLIVGEPGSGKLTLARKLTSGDPDLDPIVVVDCKTVTEPSERWADHVRTIGEAARVFVLRHLDRIDVRTGRLLAQVLEGLAGRPSPPRVIATVTERAHRQDVLDVVFDRFAIVTVEVPPLRDRAADLPALVSALTSGLDRRARWSAEALEVLGRRGWPGNVRELENVVQRTLSNSGGLIRVADLPLDVRQEAGRRSFTKMERAERDAIMTALENSRGNKVIAAEELGISRSSLYRKIDRYGLADAGQVEMRLRS